MKEPILEKILRRVRLSRVLPYINKESRMLDIGCGWDAKLLREVSPIIRDGFGIDFKIDLSIPSPSNIQFLQKRFDQESLPFANQSFDIVTLLAVLEHIEPIRVDFVLNEVKRVLKRGGKLLLTVPTPSAKPVLEFLSFKLGLINRDEILDHKLYYSKHLLHETLIRNGYKIQRYRFFQLRMNSFCAAISEGIPV